jgi:hypothetical protein
MDHATEQERNGSIAAPTGKDHDQPFWNRAVVYFDPECPLCRSLATFMGQRVDSHVMRFAPSPEPNPMSLVVEFEENGGWQQLSGEVAWAWMLSHHPALHELNWLAQKLGISGGTARALMAAGGVLKRMCWRCRR